jgi:tetratricopeptide (TPR) repeat protein
MNPSNYRSASNARLPSLVLTLLLTGFTGMALSQSTPPAEAPKETMRAEVGKPLLAAEELSKAKNFDGALAKITEAEAVPNRTAYETYFINRLRATTSLSAGKQEQAVKSLVLAYESTYMPAADKPKIGDAISRIFYRLKDYKQAAEWGTRTLKEPGAAPDLHLIVGHSLYLLNDYPAAIKELEVHISTGEKAGTKAPEEQYRLLASAANKAKDDALYVAMLEKLIQTYPKRDYWADLIYRTESKKGFNDRLTLDVYRLKLATDVLSEPSEFMEVAQYTLQLGFPTEAQKVLEAGVAAGALGKEGNQDRYKKLRDTIDKEVKEEKARAAKGVVVPNTSVAKLNNGFDLVIKGEGKKGLELMEAGLKLPDLKRPEEAKLRFGIANVLAGERAKAVEVLNSVQGADGTADVAKLWALFAKQPKE